ncbi:MAG: hypothetical protein K8W52_34515, partial [Deltaproteobacteria bacterium]|nr:hypothetical protein [Deltaproteobacteria bacterium]
MPVDPPPGDAAIRAAVLTLGASTEALERLSPAALGALARAAARFTRGAKQLRRRRRPRLARPTLV